MPCCIWYHTFDLGTLRITQIAMARTMGVSLEIDEFQAFSDKTPFIADLKPRYY
jgi:dihydroxyacid dehydratase/phosphogluconate dehydratase